MQFFIFWLSNEILLKEASVDGTHVQVLMLDVLDHSSTPGIIYVSQVT